MCNQNTTDLLSVNLLLWKFGGGTINTHKSLLLLVCTILPHLTWRPWLVSCLSFDSLFGRHRLGSREISFVGTVLFVVAVLVVRRIETKALNRQLEPINYQSKDCTDIAIALRERLVSR